MKKILQLLFLFGLVNGLQAQDTFTDDFESYQVGAFVGVSSPQWTTWSNGGEGGAEDVKVVNDRAQSGTKSIKLTGVAGGGPQDLILLFGTRRTVGTFTYQMSMYIPSNKGAYFNFQGNTARGTGGVWSMDMFFDPDGTARVTLGTGGAADILTGGFPSDTWFKLKIVANLSDNNWEIFVEDKSLGSFSNPNNFLASLDLFCVDETHEFWVDDVSYKFEPFVPAALDGAITALNVRSRGLAGTQAPISIRLKNLGNTAINSFDILVSVNNGPAVSQSFSAQNIAYLAERVIALNAKLNYNNGKNDVKVSLTNVNGGNDEKPANNEKSLSVQGVSPAPNKMVLVEEGTGTWCTWCPRGHVFMDSMARTYPDHFIGIAVHGGNGDNVDPMQINEYNNWFRTFPGFTGWPSAIVERKVVRDPSALEALFYDYIIESTPVILENGATYNASTRELKASIEGKFVEDLDGDYRFNMILVEENVKGTTAAYNQVNAYAGGGNGPMGGFELLPNPVPAARMTYQDVARALLDGTVGQEGHLPNSIKSNSTYFKEYTYTIPATLKYENLKLVGILYGPGGEVVNATETTIDEAIQNGLATSVGDPVYDPQIIVSPNPASTFANLHIDLTEASQVELTIFNVVGKAVASKDYGTLQGTVNLPVQTSLLENGAYLVQMKINNKLKTAKLVVNK